MPLRRRDHVNQSVGREEAPPDHFVGVAHEGPAEWREEPLFFEGIPPEEDAGVDDADLVARAGQVDTGEEFDVDGVLKFVREVSGDARMAVGEVVYPAERHEVARCRQYQHGARGRMGREVAGHFKERGYARGLVRTGGHGRHGRNGVVVGVEDDDLLLQHRMRPRNLTEDIVGRPPFPGHASFCPDVDRTVGFEVFDQGPGRCLFHPEAGEVEGDLEVLLLSVDPRGVVWFREDHGTGAKLGGPLPVYAGIEVHQEDGAGGIDAVEVRPLAVADVVKLPRDAPWRRRGGAHQVGPKGVKGDRPGLQGRGIQEGQFAAFVQGDGRDEFLHLYVLEADFPHAIGQVVRRFGGTRVTGYPRAEGHQVGNGLPDPRRVDHGGHLADADGFGQDLHPVTDTCRLAGGDREQCKRQDQAGKMAVKGSFKVQGVFPLVGWDGISAA